MRELVLDPGACARFRQPWALATDPMVASSAHGSGTGGQAPGPGAGGGDGEPVAPHPRVLVIDDERMITTMLSRLLSTDCNVVVANHGADAIERFARGERFDLVLCDIMMPGVSGMDVYQALEQLAPDQAERVVFITGGATSASIRAFVDQFRNRLVEKPFDTVALRAYVRAWLER